MRQSTARLVNTQIRLAQLRFPAGHVHVARTRLIFVHLDNLLHFAKVDRDGRVDGYVAAYLPDEVVLLLLRGGELATAVSIDGSGRRVVPTATALDDMRREVERSELVFCDAPFEQIAWMYASCSTPAEPRILDADRPELLFPELKQEQFSGVLELIVDGQVNYFRFGNGGFVDGYFCDKAEDTSVSRHIETLFKQGKAGGRPAIAAAVFPESAELPVQAPPELVQTYRELFWAITDAADAETSGEATKHALRYRDLASTVHVSLKAVGLPLDREPIAIVATPEELNLALSDWALQFLEQVEIVAPGVAPAVLEAATRNHRFVLQKAGFYDRLPWTVNW